MRRTNRALTALTAVALTATLAACGGNKNAASSSTSQPDPASQATSATTESAPGAETAAPTDGASEPPTESAAPTSSAPAPGATVTAKGKAFTVALPADWEDATAAVGTAGVELQARRVEPLGDYQPVVLVTSGPSQPGALAALIKNTGEKKAKEVGASMTMASPRTIGGVQATGYQIEGTIDGKKLTQREYYVQKGTKLYIVTVSLPTAQLAAAGTEADQVVDSLAFA